MDNVIVVSENPLDLEFAKSVAKELSLGFKAFGTPGPAAEYLTSTPGFAALFLDSSSARHHESLVRELGPLGGALPPDKSHLIADLPFQKRDFLYESPITGDLIKRSPKGLTSSAQLYASSVVAAATPTFGLRRFLESSAKIKCHKLQSSQDRQVTIEAILKVSQMAGFSKRAANRIAVAIDELLMNAIFDAPSLAHRMGHGKILKTDTFPLYGRAVVDVCIAYDGKYFCVSVGDNFGSITRAGILSYLAGPLKKPEPGEQVPLTGLGLAAVQQSSGSISFVCQPGYRTEVLMLFEVSNSSRAIKESFQFINIQVA